MESGEPELDDNRDGRLNDDTHMVQAFNTQWRVWTAGQ